MRLEVSFRENGTDPEERVYWIDGEGTEAFIDVPQGYDPTAVVATRAPASMPNARFLVYHLPMPPGCEWDEQPIAVDPASLRPEYCVATVPYGGEYRQQFMTEHWQLGWLVIREYLGTSHPDELSTTELQPRN